MLSLCDVVVRSPGVSRYRPEAEALAAAGVEMTTGTRLWFAEHPAARAIGITGTKGKSTTASLVAHMAGRLGLDVRLAGNIGVPLASFLGPADAAEPDLWVLELSSFQTSDLDASPSVGVLLNLYREHTDWHGTPERYRADKLNLFAHRAGHALGAERGRPGRARGGRRAAAPVVVPRPGRASTPAPAA